MEYSFYLVTLLLVIACNDTHQFVETEIEPNSDTSFVTLIEDGAWCWFSDPRAIYYEGDAKVVFFGYINRIGDVMIASHDIISGMTKTFTLHDSLEIDDHNVPSILILPDGHILAFYNEHNGDVFMRKSVLPANISKWEPERVIAAKNEDFSYTYTNPVQLESEGGRIFVFGRKVGPTRSFDHWKLYYKYSDDEGLTWSDDVILLDNEGRVNPPYMKIASDNLSRIDVLFTDGHPKIGDDVSVFHMYYENEEFFQTNGNPIGRIVDLPLAIASVNKVYDASKTRIRSWIWDIALNGQRQPVITYARYPTENDHRYHYTYWDGDKWIDEEICKSGGWMPSLRQGDRVAEAHYSGGVVLDHKNPKRVFLSRQINAKFEIEQMNMESDGTWTSTFLTSNSQENNIRPYVVYDSPLERSMVLWMNGIYRHYTDYNTRIKLYR